MNIAKNTNFHHKPTSEKNIDKAFQKLNKTLIFSPILDHFRGKLFFQKWGKTFFFKNQVGLAKLNMGF